MFIVCGEALFDLFSTGPTPTGLGFDARIGGSPFNVALGLARLAQPVGFLGGIGQGFAGDRLMQALHDEGIDTRCTPRLAAPATLSLVGLDAQGVPSYAFYGEGCADRLLQPAHLDAIPPEARAFHFGSYAMVVPPTADTQRRLVERIAGRQFVAYDPNIRLNVEPSIERWRETLAWMAPRCDLLKVSEEDLALLYPGLPIDDFLSGALAAGVALAVVTRGGDGVVARSAGAAAARTAPRIAVVDTVGAGDSFQAALLTWLAEHDRLHRAGTAGLDGALLGQALDFAVKAAAITCGRRGADLPRRAELPAG